MFLGIKLNIGFLIVSFLAIEAFSQDPVRILSYKSNTGDIINGLGQVYDAAFSPDGNYVGIAGSQGAFLWDLNGDLQEPVQVYPFISDNNTNLGCVEIEFTEDSETLRLKTAGVWFERGLNDGIPFGVDVEFEPVPLIPESILGDSGSLSSQNDTVDEVAERYPEIINAYSGTSAFSSPEILDFSSDSRWALRNGIDQIHLIDINNRNIAKSYPISHTEAAYAVFSPDTTKVAAFVNSRDVTSVDILVWDRDSGEKLFETVMDRGFAYNHFDGIYFSEDGQRLMVVQHSRADVIDINAQTIIHTAHYDLEEFSSSTVTPTRDLRKLLILNDESYDAPYPLLIYDVETGEEIQRVNLEVPVRRASIKVLPNNQVFIGSRASSSLVDLSNEIVLGSLSQVVLRYDEAIGYSANSEWLVFGRRGVRVLHVPTFKLLPEITTYYSNFKTSLKINDENKKIYVGYSDGSILELELPALSGARHWEYLD